VHIAPVPRTTRSPSARDVPFDLRPLPELPDVTVYVERLRSLIAGERVEWLRIVAPFVLRSIDPPVAAVQGARVAGIERLGKRIIIELDAAERGAIFIVIHLMIAGRLRWRPPRAKAPGGKMSLAELAFAHGTLYLTEAGTKRRASIHLVAGRDGLADFDRGGLEVLDADLATFATRLRSENHTLKRSLTDPRLFSGIGNAYSDEILHRAKLSPMALSSKLTDDAVATLFTATRETLLDWTERLRREVGDGFPEKVTAFREGMAVHGRYGQPCPVCGSPVQRIRYADNETNYCATCQTGGRLLADRALSRLLKEDWPRSLDAMDEMLGRRA
jgi:formamidopyrimidine-DNA glycosylase